VHSSFSDLEYAAKKRKTRRDRFLAEIEAVTPRAYRSSDSGERSSTRRSTSRRTSLRAMLERTFAGSSTSTTRFAGAAAGKVKPPRVRHIFR
jgi:hypothetical protein